MGIPGIIVRSTCCRSLVIQHDNLEGCSFGEDYHLGVDCALLEQENPIGTIRPYDCTHYKRTPA